MPLQLATDVRTAMLDAIEATIGTSAILKIFDGALPANCAAADAGTALVVCSLPLDWMAAASNGTKAKLGTWEDLLADATGSADYFRIYTSGGTVCKIQGTVTATGGGGDMTVVSINIAAGQSFTITGFTLTAGGA
jgi:hypothetical protein